MFDIWVVFISPAISIFEIIQINEQSEHLLVSKIINSIKY